ncbi:YerC/YecD family TrpR-related protein [Legionella bononiensis]|uniref:Helix-turn-helix domain-containing protein n=1 Tax=Legionella bononiensis TaxID=2793102 RepID=A0ABS1WBU8_9GAMM|nr:YerC/YecD family TrpR-related protein [Legionella bononiensis]MBL7481118.1 helix-turn-helix domain-containing protein [Legionella bononiensis]MBL7526827.1 helix-turn-helix domain-containing protein [Legionella bononiensis]MBL7564234.1 helix-turn-helix domain-containing protein [Legionella bononiensis]
MKLHNYTKNSALPELMQAISLLNDKEEALQFFTDLCTPAELESMADRWQVVPLLRQGMPYRTIHDQTAVSVTTITRVARCLSFGTGGYKLIADRMENL